MTPCDCINWCRDMSQEHGIRHHRNCPKYETESFPVLFYFEESVGGWIVAPKHLENIINTDNLSPGDHQKIEFKCALYTDADLAALPEI